MFLSYSRSDSTFAERLAASVQQSYEVWLDRDDLVPGVSWEAHIQDGIEGCDVFMVVVSPHSNESEWVARETLLAERLRRHRVPILLNGELPLRLINVQYVDFRGGFEGGLQDLLKILQDHLDPRARTSARANELIGDGITAHLRGDRARADDMISRGLAVSPELPGWTLPRFWSELRASGSTTSTPVDVSNFFVSEHTERLDDHRYPDRDAYRWSIEISTTGRTSLHISHVEYTLHPSFTIPSQTVRSAESCFRLTLVGWGTFRVGIAVHLTDGRTATGSYQLRFTDVAGAPLEPVLVANGRELPA